MKQKKKVSKILSMLLAVVLTLGLSANALIVTALAADITATITTSTTVGGFTEGNSFGAASMSNGITDVGWMCMEPEGNPPAVGHNFDITPVSGLYRVFAYMASQTSDQHRLWNIHHAVSQLNGTNNHVWYAEQQAVYAEAQAFDTSTIPSSFVAFSGNPTTAGGDQICLFWGTNPTGNLQLVKSSSNTDCTNGNAMYSLSGAQYGVYATEANANADSNRLGTLTTLADGTSNVLELDAANYCLKEVTAPMGYALDTTVYTVTVASGETTSKAVSDKPQNDPATIILQKKPTVNGTEAGVTVSMAGAEYTARYFDGQYTTAEDAEASGAPTRTWILATDEDGYCDLSEGYKVGGDAFFTISGIVSLPLGTLLIQETKAPAGFELDETVYVRNITSNTSGETVSSYNAPTSPEPVMMGNIQIIKHTDTGATKVETPEEGATFEIYLTAAGSYDAANAVERDQLTIDKDGMAESKALPYGTYTVHQTSGWEGSAIMDDFQVNISENGKTYSYIINNQRFYSYLKVVKVDALTGSAIPAEGIGFKIYDPQGNLVSFWGVDTFYSDKTGTVKVPVELEYGKGYTAVEVSAPAGYVLSTTPTTFDVVENAAHQEEGLTVITVEVKNTPTQVKIAKVDYQGNYVAGATMQLTDATGAIADEWVTTNEAHTIMRLPVGSVYTLHEAASPEGWLIADDMTITVADTESVQTFSMMDEQIPEIHTTATVNGNHYALADGTVLIEDLITYSKVIPGKPYQTVAHPMDPATGTAYLDANGNSIAVPIEFTPTETDGSVIAPVEIDASLLAGKNVVMFEDLYRDGKLVAAHNDLTDEGQTVHFPRIETTATVNGNHSVTAQGTVIINEVVRYLNMEAGAQLMFTASPMDQKTGKPVTDVNGNPILIPMTITATAAEGTVSIPVEVDASQLGGKSVTMFERCYVISSDGSKDQTLIAVHEDLTSVEQTVSFTPVVKTGDASTIILWLALGSAALLGMGVVIVTSRRKSSKKY